MASTPTCLWRPSPVREAFLIEDNGLAGPVAARFGACGNLSRVNGRHPAQPAGRRDDWSIAERTPGTSCGMSRSTGPSARLAPPSPAVERPDDRGRRPHGYAHHRPPYLPSRAPWSPGVPVQSRPGRPDDLARCATGGRPLGSCGARTRPVPNPRSPPGGAPHRLVPGPPLPFVPGTPAPRPRPPGGPRPPPRPLARCRTPTSSDTLLGAEKVRSKARTVRSLPRH